MSQTIFEKIVTGELASWPVWEDEAHLAFLTPFPNTRGQTVVIPKVKYGEYVFGLSDDQYLALLLAIRAVARILERAFQTPRVAMVFEGTGVAYVHAKLYPLHGKLAAETNVWSTHQEFYPAYVGYLTTVEGPRMSDAELDAIQALIRGVQQSRGRHIRHRAGSEL
jgi:diadenosine tetraphosphate (Ap4A) HIT family hydrolase